MKNQNYSRIKAIRLYIIIKWKLLFIKKSPRYKPMPGWMFRMKLQADIWQWRIENYPVLFFLKPVPAFCYWLCSSWEKGQPRPRHIHLLKCNDSAFDEFLKKLSFPLPVSVPPHPPLTKSHLELMKSAKELQAALQLYKTVSTAEHASPASVNLNALIKRIRRMAAARLYDLKAE